MCTIGPINCGPPLPWEKLSVVIRAVGHATIEEGTVPKNDQVPNLSSL